VDTF
jgi:DNA repair photolyase